MRRDEIDRTFVAENTAALPWLHMRRDVHRNSPCC
jgi:hypothetical protein